MVWILVELDVFILMKMVVYFISLEVVIVVSFYYCKNVEEWEGVFFEYNFFYYVVWMMEVIRDLELWYEFCMSFCFCVVCVMFFDVCLILGFYWYFSLRKIVFFLIWLC